MILLLTTIPSIGINISGILLDMGKALGSVMMGYLPLYAALAVGLFVLKKMAKLVDAREESMKTTKELSKWAQEGGAKTKRVKKALGEDKPQKFSEIQPLDAHDKAEFEEDLIAADWFGENQKMGFN